MVQKAKVQTIALIAVGVLIGYAIASHQADLSNKSTAAETNRASAPAPVANIGPLSAAEPRAVCLTEPKSKSEMLAMADPRVIAASARIESNGKKPNILFIMGDDVGWFNIGAYHRGMMSGKTPHLDKLAREGMLFTDYYAEASCTAGRANFITGEIPLRTGLTTVGQAGADVGLPAQACTIATALKELGYATGQFGKNHLGDLNKYLPTVHGFDEFFGYLYHLDAMSDPYWFDYPQDWIDKTGPRDLVHCFATDIDDGTVELRWGKVGKQKIIDEGPLAPFPNMKDMQNWQKGRPAKYDMETFDEVLVKSSCDFMDRAKQAGKPFFVWHNTTRMHVFTYLSPKYQSMMNAKNNYNVEEAGMAQMDDSVGALLQHLEDIGEADNTIVVFSTDNGAEVFTWPDGGMTPFKATKGTSFEGGFRVPCIARWPGHIKPGTVENGIFSGLDWFPTFVAAAGNPDITDQLLQGVKLGERTYKNHLDGYNQLDLLEGQGPSKRHELFYFAGPMLGAIRLDDFKYQFLQQPYGWPGEKTTTDMPTIVNLRQDPFERTPSIRGQSLNDMGGGYMNDFYAREFWRFVDVQKAVGKLALTAIDYPPMQDPASFNLDAIKKKIEAMIKQHEGEQGIDPGERPAAKAGRSPLFYLIAGLSYSTASKSTVRCLLSRARSAFSLVLQAVKETPSMFTRCFRVSASLLVVPLLLLASQAFGQPEKTDPLPSWNDGPAKNAIVEFVRVTTDKESPKYVSPEKRIATFDQDGTLWVEHPMYSQVMYCLDRVPAVVERKLELKNVEPFKTVLSGDREAIAKLPMKDLEAILAATLTGMSVDDFSADVKKWLATAKHPRWRRPYTELTYQPMQEVLSYFRANGFKTYIVTGGGQDFVRVYAEQVYGIPPEQVVGSAGGTKYGYAADGKPFLTKEPKLLLNDNNAGKPEGIHLMIGRRPYAAFGNSTGDRQMLEYTGAGDGARLMMLVLHDDATREYAYGPAEGLPDSKVGTFTQALYDEAKKDGWTVISMKGDWKRIFAFEK